MKLDLSAHDEDAHGAIKTAEGLVVVPFVLLLDSLKAGRPWRVEVAACIDTLKRASVEAMAVAWAELHAVAEQAKKEHQVTPEPFKGLLTPPTDAAAMHELEPNAADLPAWPLGWYRLTAGKYPEPLEGLRRDELRRLADEADRQASARSSRFSDFVCRRLQAGVRPVSRALTIHQITLEWLEEFGREFDAEDQVIRRFVEPQAPPHASIPADGLELLDRLSASIEGVQRLADLWGTLAGQMAIALEDVRRVFPELEIVGDDGAEAIFRQMESAGIWPRPEVPKGQAGSRWLDAEREAAFELRHRFKVSDADLKQRIDVSRTAINEQIWPKQGRRWELAEPSCAKWKPPVVLLRRCGLPVPGLHEVERVPEPKRALSPAK